MAARNRVAEILVQAGVIDEMQLRSALAQQEHWGGRLAHILAEKKFAPEAAIADALAKGLSLQRITLTTEHDPAALHKLDARFCKEKAIYPVSLRDNGKTLLVALADPSDMELLDEIGRRSRTRVTIAVAGETEIQGAIDRHYFGKEPMLAPMPRKSSKAAAIPAEAPGEQFKITDLSGSTRVGENPARSTAPAPAADAMLDELLGGAAPALSEEDLARIQSIAENQEKAGKILQALTELLREKGIT